MTETDAASHDPKAVPGLAARKAAIRMLDAVLRRGEPLDRAQHAATQGLKLHADRALALAIASEVLRHMAGLDGLIDSATGQILPDDAKPRMVLRMMLVQALVLETPPHAVVAANLPLLTGGPKRLAHGVFGTLMRREAKLPEANLPPTVTARWKAQWGDDVVTAASAAFGHAPPLDLILADAGKTAIWAEATGGESLISGHIRLARDGAIEQIAGFDEGAWWVQDIAASLPARMLGQGDGRSVLDLCAAPGGKTMQLASNGWQVEAIDKSIKRLTRLEQNLARTGLNAITHQADLLEWQPASPVDAILLDAPCSATGIFRRHPDVVYRIAAHHIAELAAFQARLLDRISGWLKPGGTLVYAVCSLEREEGEEQVSAFLDRHPDFALDPIDAAILPHGVTPTSQGTLRTLPGMLDDKGGLDGFFAARLRKI